MAKVSRSAKSAGVRSHRPLQSAAGR